VELQSSPRTFSYTNKYKICLKIQEDFLTMVLNNITFTDKYTKENFKIKNNAQIEMDYKQFSSFYSISGKRENLLLYHQFFIY